MDIKLIVTILILVVLIGPFIYIPIKLMLNCDKPKNDITSFTKALSKIKNSYEMSMMSNIYDKIYRIKPENIMKIYYTGSTTCISYYKIYNIEISKSNTAPYVRSLHIYDKNRPYEECVTIFPDSEESCKVYDMLLELVEDKIQKYDEEQDKIREKLQKKDYEKDCKKAYKYLLGFSD